MSDRGAAIDFMHTFLPAAIISHLDTDAFILDSTSFIDEKMNQRFADLLFEVPVKKSKEKVTIAILIELKSQKDKFIHFQLLEYVAMAYRSQITQKKKLSLIIPVIYYHGKQTWAPGCIAEFFKDVPVGLKEFIPTFEFIFADLKIKSADEIAAIGNSLLYTALQIQLLQFLQNIDVSVLTGVFTRLDPDKYGNYINPMIVYLFKYIDSKQKFNTFISKIQEPIKSETMTFYNEIITEGIAKGKAEGKAEGIAEGEAKSKTEIVINAHANGIALSMIKNITGLTTKEIKNILKIN